MASQAVDQQARAPKVTIFGSGLVGSQWAMLYASAGYQVALHDAQEGQASRALNKIASRLSELAQAGQLRGSLTPQQQRELISAPATLAEALQDAFLVQECVFEDVEVKRRVFQLLDAEAPPQAILCSSTSCIMPSEFCADLTGRSRCLVAHPINPPYFLPLVELVPTPHTDPTVLATVKATLQGLGQEPIVIKAELDGFAVNRLQYAVINEAWRLVASGAMSAEDVDKVMTCGLAPRYCFLGPLAVMQTNANGIRDYCRRFGAGLGRVSATFGPTPSYDQAAGDEIERVASQLDALMPVDSLPDICQRRDQFLAALAQMKRNFGASSSSPTSK